MAWRPLVAATLCGCWLIGREGWVVDVDFDDDHDVGGSFGVAGGAEEAADEGEAGEDGDAAFGDLDGVFEEAADDEGLAVFGDDAGFEFAGADLEAVDAVEFAFE